MSSVISKLGKIFRSPKEDSTQPKPPETAKAVILDLVLINSLIKSLKEGVIILDLQSKAILQNREAARLTNYKDDEIQGKALSSLISFSSNEKKVDPEQIELAKNQLLILHGKNDAQANVQLTSSTILDSSKREVAKVIILQNVSEKTSLQEMQVDFVSMASHELRTPLTSIVNYLSVLEEEARAKMDKEHQEFLDRSFNATKQLLLLVENILSVSKVERGATSLNIKTTNWQDLLDQIIKELKMQAIEKNINLSLVLPKDPLPDVMADPLRITEVLDNLIANAIKHTNSGGFITVKAIKEKGEVITSVEDNGEGIAKEALPNLFAKFYRTPGSLQKGDQGTGLGLYISKSIIGLHHGRIWADSNLGKGSTFFFSLPIATDAGPSVADLVK